MGVGGYAEEGGTLNGFEDEKCLFLARKADFSLPPYGRRTEGGTLRGGVPPSGRGGSLIPEGHLYRYLW